MNDLGFGAHKILKMYTSLAQSLVSKTRYSTQYEAGVIEYAGGLRYPFTNVNMKGVEPLILIHSFGIGLLNHIIETSGNPKKLPQFHGKLEFLDFCPTNKTLVWRIEPELAFEEDFDTKDIKYSIYACYGLED